MIFGGHYRWSAQWDKALSIAFERCKSHRFTTYWALKGELNDEAKKIIQSRRAEIIKINDANFFFKEISQKVSALQDIERPHPISSKIAVASLKKYLAEERFRIQVHDLVLNEANKLHKEYSGDQFSLNTPINFEELERRILRYETSTEILRDLLITGCYWGTATHEQIWAKCLDRTVVPIKEKTYSDIWDGLRFYPSLLLLYAGGISSLLSNNFNNFSAMLSLPKYLKNGTELPLILFLSPLKVIKKQEAEIVFNMKNNYVPVSDHLQILFKEHFNEYLPDEKQFINIFDRFEYLFALVYTDIREKNKKTSLGPIGCFFWRNRDEPEKHIINKINKESSEKGDNWPILKAGLFDGSYERFQYIQKEYYEFFQTIPYI